MSFAEMAWISLHLKTMWSSYPSEFGGRVSDCYKDRTKDYGRKLNMDSVSLLTLGLRWVFPAQPVCRKLVTLGVHSLFFI
jgi:hypothetical protein